MLVGTAFGWAVATEAASASAATARHCGTKVSVYFIALHPFVVVVTATIRDRAPGQAAFPGTFPGLIDFLFNALAFQKKVRPQLVPFIRFVENNRRVDHLVLEFIQ